MPAIDDPKDDPKNLTELLLASGRGDQAAFETLYGICAPRLLSMARRLLRRQELAEEILQDCFVSIWLHAANFKPELSAPLTWMFNIVRNRCLDNLRRPDIEAFAADHAPFDEAPFGDVESNLPDGLASIIAAREAKVVREQLGALAPRERQMIALAFFKGLSHAEIAAHVGEPLGTVKTLVRRGLTRLRASLPHTEAGRPFEDLRIAA